MKMLFITPQIPYPPQKGTTTRNFKIIENLARHHAVHLLCFGTEKDAGGIKVLGELCQSVQVAQMPRRNVSVRIRDLIVDPVPDLAVRLASSEFVAKLRETLQSNRFDILQIEGLEMAWHWELASRGWNAKDAVRSVVLDEHNAEYVLQRRAFEIDRLKPAKWAGAAYSLVQWQKLARFEAATCQKMNAVVTVSEEDRMALRAITRLPATAIVPNGVDVEYFRPTEVPEENKAPALVFCGTMDFRPNVDAVIWLCEEILPLIGREVGDVKLYVVGRDPKSSVERLTRYSNVIVTGFVEDVRPYVHRASVYVVPMRFGGGVRFKVVEAMAMGIPVVSTPMGAEGIEVNHGEHLLIAEDPASFARQVTVLLNDKQQAQRLARNARALVERKYDWRKIVPKLEELYREVV